MVMEADEKAMGEGATAAKEEVMGEGRWWQC